MNNVFVTTTFDLSLPADYNPLKVQKELKEIIKNYFKGGALLSEVTTKMELDKDKFPIYV